MSWGIVAGAAIGVVGSAVAGRSAGRAQQRAADSANATQLAMYDQNREDLAPWREAGGAALGQISAGLRPGGQFARDFSLADFRADPGYQFRLNQGLSSIEGSAAARGGALSGATLSALTRYGQDFASQEFGNAYQRWNADRDRRYNRLSSVAGLGQTATNTTAGLGAGAAAGVAGNQIGAGNSRAAEYISRGNTLSNLAGTAGSMYWLNQQRPAAAPAPAPAAAPADYTWYDG